MNAEPVLTVEDIEENMMNPLWRLNNLYSIVTKRDGVQPFRPFPYQQKLFEDIFLRGRRKHIIVKARRMGFSTAIAVLLLDQCLFNTALQASIVDLTQEDAREKVRSKVRVAWEAQPLLAALGLKAKPQADPHWGWNNGSHLYAGINARGGTNHLLHISEWGPIAHMDPSRSKKILTGALPSADEGIVMIETTWMGGKTGELWQILKDAMEVPAAQKTEQDFWLTFVAWFEDPRHTLPGIRAIDSVTTKYLDTLEADLGISLSTGQRLWYFVNSLRYKEDMTQEYPSTIEEATERRVAGSIYGKWVSKARHDGRKGAVPHH